MTDAKARRFRYGVQVNSLGLTEAQPENNVQRIVLEMLGVTLSKRARARSAQLPAWNEALRAAAARGTSSGRCGCSRCWRSRATCCEYDDIFDGSHVITETARITGNVVTGFETCYDMSGAFEGVVSVAEGHRRARLNWQDWASSGGRSRPLNHA